MDDVPQTRIPQRRGLVLQGGGAKGAFQYGALKELHSVGFDFDVISGTSVGALNGAVVSTDSWDQGDLLWTHLSMQSAFSWRKLSAIYTVLSLPGIIFFGWATNQFEETISYPLKILFTFIASLPSLVFFGLIAIALLPSSSPIERWLLTTWLFILTGFGLAGMYEKQSWFRPSVCIGFATLLAMWSGWAVFHLAALIHLARGMPLQSIGLAITCSSPVLMIVGYVHQLLNASLLSNRPLRTVVSTISKRPFRKPLFATTSELVPEYVDPDDFSYMRMGRGAAWVAVQRSGFLATYNRIDKVSSDKFVDTLLASAALPLGVVPNVFGTKKGSRFVDGGLADNTPWHPLVSDYPCTELLIILCEPVQSIHRPAIDVWQQREGSMRVMKSGYQPTKFTAKTPWSSPSPIAVRNSPPTEIPMPKPGDDVDFSRVKITVIGPPKPLGGLVSATMNFDASRALANIELGRKAAKDAIAAGLRP
jgi:predicted acylesterase/phospholipase RssA